MGWLSRIFGKDPESRISRARKFLADERFVDARWELEELDHPEAAALLEEAMAGLIMLNIEQARALFNADDRDGAKEHLEMARTFGASSAALRDVRKEWRMVRAAEEAAAARTAQQLPDPEGDDPLWALPPDDPRLQYAMRVEGWPEQLRRRLVELGPGFAEAVAGLDEGKVKAAYDALGAYVAQDPIARYERARAALALGRLPAAVSDLQTFGDEVGHRLIGTEDTAVLTVQTLARLGRMDTALAVVEAELARRPLGSLKAARASLLEAKGEYAEAEEEAFALLEQAPRDMGLVKLLARTRMRQGKRMAAMQALEGGMSKACNTPGKCGYQPYDVAAGRMLAQLYLEDRLDPKRAAELMRDIAHNRRGPEWQDGYLEALQARNEGDPALDGKLAQLKSEVPEGDPRLGLLQQQFSDVPQLTG